ncbi:MAG TPA: proline--tRNA ligase [Candidatus Saccharimonadales bacterium]|nr:proline--tRNA ligase [Candidatus Saccharimonadales bacterium]
MNKLPDIATNFPEWYQEVIYAAKLADHAPVRGCIVIRPYGNAIWENIKKVLDDRIKETGHENALFPLFIPQSFLSKEAEHVEGFAPELAVVTHAGGKELEEPLVVRPTSETMIHHMFAQWIHSYRDLPLKINQWANVVRWEKRPRAFLRTTEFYWQEGHTAHESRQEALDETLMMLDEYVKLAQDYLAIPVIKGRKTKNEQFPGAEATYTFEGFMIDGKALQMGTSHLLSQSFAHAFDMKYQDKYGEIAYPYLTSWGTTTRLVGAVIASHGDERGLIIPPKIAPIQVVIVPILRKETKDTVIDYVKNVQAQLKAAGICAHVDLDEHISPGAKFYEWELKGVPLRLEVGPRDMDAGIIIATSRLGKEKETVQAANIVSWTKEKLESIQAELFKRAQNRYARMWHKAEKLSDFIKNLEEHNGIYQVGWCGQLDCEVQLKQHSASIRCMIESKDLKHCFACGKDSMSDVIVGKAY